MAQASGCLWTPRHLWATSRRSVRRSTCREAIASGLRRDLGSLLGTELRGAIGRNIARSTVRTRSSTSITEVLLNTSWAGRMVSNALTLSAPNSAGGYGAAAGRLGHVRLRLIFPADGRLWQGEACVRDNKAPGGRLGVLGTRPAGRSGRSVVGQGNRRLRPSAKLRDFVEIGAAASASR